MPISQKLLVRARLLPAFLGIWVMTGYGCSNDRSAPTPPDMPNGLPAIDPLTSSVSSIDPSIATLSGLEGLIVAMGGWNSCVSDDNSTADSPIGNFAKAGAQPQAQITWQRTVTLFTTCFNSGADKFIFQRSDKLEAPLFLSFEELAAIVEEFHSSHQTTIHVMGHSYGGFYAMKLVAALDGKVPVQQLLTFDPISPIGCTPIKFALSAASLKPEEACTEFPKEIGIQDRLSIQQQLKLWDHFYVRDALGLLHSSAIETAVNHFVNLPIDKVLNAHMHIFSEPSVWTLVKTLVSGSRH